MAVDLAVGNNRIVAALKDAPANHIDPTMLELIEKWSRPPRSVEVLEFIDKGIDGGLCSKFALSALKIFYQQLRDQEEVAQHAI